MISGINSIRVFPAITWLIASAAALADQDLIEFDRDIRPILSDNCFACHGFDAKKRKAKLRLDTAEGAYAARSDLPAITPFELQESELWHRITAADADELMPPPGSHKQLTDDEKDLLKRWIEAGAAYQPHWSFVPPQKAELPRVKNRDWSALPIDKFILARLEAEGLDPSPEADRRTLIRRVTLDLTGLPPTPEEVDAFLRDTEPGTYGRLVDRLLQKRGYAERSAQDWLDLARYADTRGFADDRMRQIWPYRDWVIRVLHRNMPFDQFTIEQLAGDMLPNATDEQLLATAFHRNAPQARGQTYPEEEYRIKGVKDRVNTTGKVWLGLTVECAECHDHKFDPFSQRDYYSLFAIFNNIVHLGKDMNQGGPTMKYRFLSDTDSARPSAVTPGDHGLLEKWDGPAVAEKEARFDLTGDLSITAKIKTTQPVAEIVSKYDWRGKQRSYVFGIGGEEDTNAVPGHLYFWVSSRADTFAGLTVYGSIPVIDGREHDVAVVFKAGKFARLYVDGREDIDARFSGVAPKSIAISERRLAIGSGYNNSSEPNAWNFKGELRSVKLYRRAIEAREFGGQPAHKTDALPVMREMGKPRDTFIHQRGNFLHPGGKVGPAVASLFKMAEGVQPRNRLQFARWLVDSRNPLVARVTVNRFWQRYFGEGLVRTGDDFGAQGATPSHPALLDWLACEFIESGWDMKHIHRLIVTSATYRQSARVSPELAQRDPNNLLLARMPRVRLPAEQIRDQALALSGLLKPFDGGKSVFPPQPEDYWEERDLPGKWTVSRGDDLHRKSLYIYWRRMALHPTMEILDAPSRAVCVVKRNSSNLPTQALVTLNDPIFVEATQALAKRVLEAGPSDRVSFAFRLCLGRPPKPDEREQFAAFIKTNQARYGDDSLATWSSVAAVLLNLDETLTRP